MPSHFSALLPAMWQLQSAVLPTALQHPQYSASSLVQELVQQILRLAPFGLGATFLGAPLPASMGPKANGTLVNGVNGHHPANGTSQVRHRACRSGGSRVGSCAWIASSGESCAPGQRLRLGLR